MFRYAVLGYLFYCAAVYYLGSSKCGEIFDNSAQAFGVVSDEDIPQNTKIASNHLIYKRWKTPLESWGKLKIEQAVGKYAVKSLKMGTSLAKDMVGDQPVLVKTQGMEFLKFPLDGLGLLAELVNAGTRLKVYEDKKFCCASYGPYVVEAVLGAEKESVAVVRVPAADACKLSKFSNLQVHLESQK